MSVIDVLKWTRNLLEKNGWCQKYYAINAEGKSADDEGPNAVAFCLSGAINKACHELFVPLRVIAKQEIIKDLPVDSPDLDPSIIRWNDHVAKSKEDVLKQLDKTIERLEREAQ